MKQQLAILLEFAIAALAHYVLPTGLSLELVNLSENATYRITAPNGQRWALRVHREGYHSRGAIESELAWFTALRNEGVAVTPRPLVGLDGKIVQEVRHSLHTGLRHVVLTEWEDGVEPRFEQDLLKPFEVLGEVAARMHDHARQWRRPPGFERFTWDFETALGEGNPHWGRWRHGLGVDAARAKLFQRTVDVIERRLLIYGKDQNRFGLVHGDLRLANFLIDGDVVKVLDFDDCGFSWFMYDAATPISFHEHAPEVPNLIEAWKVGYRKISVLTKEDEAEIPTLVMFRRMLLVAWIGSHSDTELARRMGVAYTEGTDELCESFLGKFS